MSRSFRNPCSQIWELLIDTSTWPRWGPSVRAVQCDERFIRQGTSGRVKTVVGIWLPFIITAYEEGRYWSWSVAGISATGHRVQPEGSGRCRVTFEVPLFAAPYNYVCKIALDRMAGILK